MQPLTREDLYAQTDLDLGNRLLERFRLRNADDWERATLVANFVEYEPVAPNRFGLHKVISRIKAEEEIWNKVVDEIFHLDSLIERDKQRRHFSRYVKDIFGVKMVVGSPDEARSLQVVLESQAWAAATLDAPQVEHSPRSRELSFLEVKDYLSDQGQKESGWRAIKSVVQWDGQLFEIQLQPLRNYHTELERFTVESHDEFKARREALRNEIAQQIPLFGFYRDLLLWLFQRPESEPPRFGSIEVELTD